MSDDQSRSGPARMARPPAWPVSLVALAVTFVALVSIGWWASQQGYVSWFGTACTDEGYDPIPSYDDLVSTFHKGPYCARLIRDETWFRTTPCHAA